MRALFEARAFEACALEAGALFGVLSLVSELNYSRCCMLGKVFRNNNPSSLYNLGNLGSMQMNMNMVMVGRQLEKFKKDKKELWDKLQAVKRRVNATLPSRAKQSSPLSDSKKKEDSDTG